MKTLLILSLFTAFIFNAKATTYYFKPDGNDALAGTSEATAWQTLSKLNNLDLNPGDSIKIKGGSSYSLAGLLYFTAQDAGSSSQPVVFTSYGTGWATINCAAGAFFFEDHAGIKFYRLNLVGPGGLNTGAVSDGIAFYNTTNTRKAYIRIDSVNVSAFNGRGIILGGNTHGYEDVLISNSNINDNIDGILTYGASGYTNANVVVRRCTTNNNIGNQTAPNPTGSGIILGFVDGGLIAYCSSDNNGAYGFDPVGIWCYDANNVTIQFCRSTNNKTRAGRVDGGGYDLGGGCSNCVIQYCYSEGNTGAGYMVYEYGSEKANTNNLVRYNISINDGRRNSYPGLQAIGLNSSKKVTNAKFYNNTVIVNGESVNGTPAAVRIGAFLAGVEFKNNIFVSQGSAKLLAVAYGLTTNWDSLAVKFQNNSYYSYGEFQILWGGTTHPSLEAWKAQATQQERNSVTSYHHNSDPLFSKSGSGAAYWKLSAVSPLRDVGLNLGSSTRDYFGNPVKTGSGQDIGAHEYVSEDLPKKTFYRDVDGDGYGRSDGAVTAATPPSAANWVTKGGDCKDWDATVNPSAAEVPNNQDDNCNGHIDEGYADITWYYDMDSDGYGRNENPKVQPVKPDWGTWSRVGGDCKDWDPAIYPGAAEIPKNGKDDDCDGQIDENNARIAAEASRIISIEMPQVEQEFTVSVWPIPSGHQFHVELKGIHAEEPVSVRIFDLESRLIEAKDNLYVGQILTIGEKYTKGIYLLQAVQGKHYKVIKIHKQ